MVSASHSVAAVIVTNIAGVAPEATPGQPTPVLSTIDDVVAVLSVVLIVVLVGWRATRRGYDPLAGAPQRPNRLRHDAVAAAVMAYLLASLVFQGVMRATFGETQGAAASLVTALGVTGVGIAVCLVIAAKQFDGGIRRFWFAREWVGPRKSIYIVAVLTVTAIGLCPIIRDAVAGVILYYDPNFEFASHPTIEALHDQSQPLVVTIALWAGAALLAPLAEELFFRGLLQTFLGHLLRDRWRAIVVTSIVFGAIHFPQPHAVLALAALSVLIGYAYERTGSILPPILIHALFNLKTLAWDALGAAPALTALAN